jgi:hypothetical protein
MPSTIEVRQPVCPGSGTSIESRSPVPSVPYAVLFEDDGETGYLYGLDVTREQPVVDALHIYNVANLPDPERPCVVDLLWTDDGLRAALFINDHPHAVFDFLNRLACCRSNFPPPDPTFTSSHQWDEALARAFR